MTSMSEPIPSRKVILYVVDVSTGKTYPVKVILASDGTALLPSSIEKDSVGLATEKTLSGIKAQTDKFIFDEYGRVYVQNPPNMDIKLSEIKAVGSQTSRTLSELYDNIGNVRSSVTDLSTRSLNEGGRRCYDVTVDDTFAVPSGVTWYVKNLYITTGSLYLDGEVKTVG